MAWHVWIEEGERGPYSAQELLDGLAARTLWGSTLAKREDDDTWAPLGEIRTRLQREATPGYDPFAAPRQPLHLATPKPPPGDRRLRAGALTLGAGLAITALSYVVSETTGAPRVTALGLLVFGTWRVVKALWGGRDG